MRNIAVYSSCAFASALVVAFADIANAANLIVNGDFSAGNSGFSSEYQYEPSDLLPFGLYTVSTDPSYFNPFWSSFGDHTTGTGNMMLVNGTPNSNTTVWSQTIAVTPNTEYNFSVWLTSTFPDAPAQLQFAINSLVIGSPFTASTTPGLWQQFNATWNSESNELANLSIVNLNTSIGGNDLALDDAGFTPVAKPLPPVTSVPEPSSILTLLAFGAFGTWLQKRKQQRKAFDANIG